MAGLHSSGFMKFVQYGWITRIYVAGFSGFMKFVQYGWITQ